MFSSNAAKQLASAALQAGETAAKDIEMKAIDVGKTVAIDAGKKLVGKAAKNYPNQSHKWLRKYLKSKRSYSQICCYKCH